MPALRLLVHVEGQTEETFVKEILGPHLQERGYTSVGARLVGNARSRDRRGGIRRWDAVCKDIVRHLREDRTCISTTIVDYYALPATGNGAWPGRADAGRLVAPGNVRAETVEAALQAAIVRQMKKDFDPRRFEPFVAMHEYEGLLFSDCYALAKSLGEPVLAPQLTAIRTAFPTPEDINDSPETAPSKRIQALIQRYEKPFHGVLALLEIGMPKVRAECPHFDRWVRRLEDRVTAKP
jgi:hypothetical protein